MPTKPRTKKSAAKPKRYVRVAVKAGKATLQESDQPNRGFKPQRQPKPAAHAPGESTFAAASMMNSPSIGGVILQKLDELLAARDAPQNPGFDAVSAWAVEKLGDGVTGYRANYAENGLAARMSPVNEAIDRLRAAITMAECATESTSERLCSALAPPLPTLNGEKPVASGAGALAGILNELAERIYTDNRRRNELLDRLEL